MLSTEIDTTYAAVIIGLVLGFFATFIVIMIIVFIRRVVFHKDDINRLKIIQSRELLQSTIQTQEEERERIGSDIHDDIGPLLSLLKLQINKVESYPLSDEIKQLLKESKLTLSESLRLLRSASNELSPSILNELGLKEAIKHMHKKINALTDANVGFNIGEDISSLSKAQSIALYRILQESLTNINRHAQAKNIEVKIAVDNKLVYLDISDDGQGFDTSIASYGLGLNNIKARVESFGGDVNIQSIPNQGTQINIKMKKDV